MTTKECRPGEAEWPESLRRFAEEPHYATCAAGAKGWYWAVWPDADAAYDTHRTTADGYAPTRAEAITTARAIAGERATENDAGVAAQQRRYLAQQRRQARPSTATSARAQGYVYQCCTRDSELTARGEASIRRHRILRITKSRYYIACAEDYAESYAGGRVVVAREPWDVRTFILDRTTLETTGHARRGDAGWWEGDYYLDPEQWRAERRQRHGPPRPVDPSLLALGLDGSASVRDVTRAYRVQAKQLHPDVAGGDAAAFQALQQTYERALQFVERRS
jgi:hypothetical protein